MLDDEIQYMGMKLAKAHQSSHPFVNSQRPLTGITLHLSKSANQDVDRMMFHRASTSVIHIGRKISTDDSNGAHSDLEKGNAVFRCPVVSRKHAKITFSDSGLVYLTDLNSHHGTHVKRRDAMSSTTLTPGLAVRLYDGDIITVGKVVGRADELVLPVIARVELCFASNADGKLPITALVSPVSNSSKTTPSGRYGLESSSSSSEDELVSEQEDSDIEEISGPSALICKRISFGGALNTVKRMIPSYTPTPPEEPSAAFSQYPPVDFEVDIDRMSEGYNRWDPSRSTSPMDLASPSPPPPNPTPPPLPPAEPVVVGAWPQSRSSSIEPAGSADSLPFSGIFGTPSMPFAFPKTTPLEINIESNDLSPERSEVSCELDSPHNSPTGALSYPEFSRALSPFLDCHFLSPLTDAPAASASSLPTDKEKETQKAQEDKAQKEKDTLAATLKTITEELEKLKSYRRSSILRCTTETAKLTKEVADLHRVTASLVDQVDTATHFDIPDLQAQVDDIQDNVNNELEDRQVATHQNDDDIEMMDGILDEMKSLRDIMNNQHATTLAAVQAARDSALADIATARAELLDARQQAKETRAQDPIDNQLIDVNMTETPSPLKRKRSDEDLSSTEMPSLVIGTHDVPSPRKRSRIIAVAAMQTVTAVTVGAAATWVALAFS